MDSMEENLRNTVEHKSHLKERYLAGCHKEHYMLCQSGS